MQSNDITKLVEKYSLDLQDITGLSTEQLLIEIMEMFLKIERKSYLGGVNDKGNGFYERLFNGLGERGLTLSIPRTRKPGFQPVLMELMKRDESRVRDLAFDLYLNGMSSRDTEEVLKKYFSKNLSHSSIVEMSNELEEARCIWEKRKLDKYYKVIYADAIRVPLRRIDSYSREAILVFMGVRADNKREILHFEVNPTESSSHYQAVLQDMKSRGLEEVDLFVTDGLKNLAEVVHEEYPDSEFQLCVVHKKRNVLNRVRVKDKKRIAADLYHVFDLFEDDNDVEEGNRRLDEFINKWSSVYPRIHIHFEHCRDHLFTYTKFSTQVRRLIYTTNSMENLNSVLRKSFRNKLSFKSEKFLLNYTFATLIQFQNKSLTKYNVNQFNLFHKQKTQSN